MAHLERHMNSVHYKNFTAAVAGAIAEKSVNKMTGISAAD
jgi:quinol monooxygenase YgiN